MEGMTAEPSARPSQVTVAGWAVAIASAFLVVAVFDAMGNLHSVDTRDAVTRAVTSGWAQGLGISVGGALTLMRWALFVSGAAAAATAILGVFVLQRNKGARIALTIAAVPVLLALPAAGNVLSVVVVSATAALWTGPAGDWFAGRPITPRAAARPEPPRPVAPPPPPVAWAPPSDPPPGPPSPSASAPAAPSVPTTPPGIPPYPNPYAQPQPWAPPDWPPQPPPVAPSRAGDTLGMPRQVRVACLLTWVFSALTGLGYAALLVALAVDRHGLMTAIKDSPGWRSSYDDSTVIIAAVVVSTLFLLWCAGAAVLAWFTWRGASWAWIVLCVSTALALMVCLVALPYSLVHLAAASYALGMLLGRRTREWFAGR